MQEHSPDYRTVAVYWTVAEAELARGLLVSDGLAPALLDALDAALLPGAGTAAIQLLVPAAELDRARELLTGPPIDDSERPDAPESLDPDRLEGPEHPERDPEGWTLAWIAFAGTAVALGTAAAALAM